MLLEKLKSKWAFFATYSILVLLNQNAHAFTDNSLQNEDTFCSEGHITFELITGYVLTSSADQMTMIPDVLQLSECIDQCRNNRTCKAVNFETGLCVLLTTNQQNSALSVSQFPVFTLYAEKICLKKINDHQMSMPWAFEKVSNYELTTYHKKTLIVESKEACLELCLLETEFACRSVNFNNQINECSLNYLDRHSVPSASLRTTFVVSKNSTDYFENNCIKEPTGLCDFRKVYGKMLKTVDSVHQNVATLEECQEICLKSKFRCFSYDFGDPNDAKKVCRTSHLDSASLTNIEEPYVSVKDAVTYQRISCYNVSISCKAKEMVAHIQTNKLFQGKIYAKTKPNSCMNDIVDSLDFELRMPYNDLLCDVKQKEQGKFTNDIVIQHHDTVVTTKDLGLALNCNYDLTNKSISNINTLNVNSDFENREEHNIHSATIGTPNVTMKITDQIGNDISAAQVGDALALHFEFVDKTSPYQMFIRELVAVDGVDSAEIMLIDEHGCPTDTSIMSSISQVEGNSQHLEAQFDAFKFPNSDIVQFRALVSPCLSSCEPAKCDIRTHDNIYKQVNSYGRRRRRRSASVPVLNENEELFVMQKIKIMDTFHLNDTLSSNNKTYLNQNFMEEVSIDRCNNFFALTTICILFLFIQVVLFFAYFILWNRKQQQNQFKHKQAFTNVDFKNLFDYPSVYVKSYLDMRNKISSNNLVSKNETQDYLPNFYTVSNQYLNISPNSTLTSSTINYQCPVKSKYAHQPTHKIYSNMK